jgi:tRNA threonylcarbamoyladenosine biosynthesis protein TsaE
MTATTVLTLPTAEDMRGLGERLASVLRAGDLVVLAGDLGAGKTTLTQGLGAGLGVRGPITSPTFVIARVHPSLRGGPALVHVDAYRLHGWDELEDLDLEASLDESVTVVEWGAGLVEGLAENRLELVLLRAHGSAADSTENGTEGGTAASAEDGTGKRTEDRTVRIRAVGERWRGVELPTVVAAG